MLFEALQAPIRSEDATGTLFVGGLLLLFSVLFPLVWLFTLLRSPIWIVLAPLAVFPPLVTLGYEVRVLAAGARGDVAPPSFVDWTGLTRIGIGSLIVRAVYLFPLFAAGTLVVAVGVLARSGRLGLGDAVTEAVLVVTAVVAGLFAAGYASVYIYLRPAALSVYAVSGDLRTALSPRRAFAVVAAGDYAVGWTLSTIVLFVGLSVSIPLQLLLVGFFLAFYVRIVASLLYGYGAADGLAEQGLLERPGARSEDGSAVDLRDSPEADPAVQSGRGVTVVTDRDTPDRQSVAADSDSTDSNPSETTSDSDQPRDDDAVTEFEWDNLEDS